MSVASSANAAFFNGTVAVGGSSNLLDASGAVTTDYTQAAQIDFVPDTGSMTGFTPFSFVPGVNTFLDLGFFFGDAVVFADILQFDPQVATPDNPFQLWTATKGVHTVSFTLTSTKVTQQDANGLDLQGSGYFEYLGSGATLEKTGAEWTYSIDGGFAFSTTNIATGAAPVPEPNTIALMGMAFAGLGIVSYRKRRA